jgi:single-strand DNA-binding protein
LKFDQWEKDGKKGSKLSVVCDKLQMLGGKGGGGGEREDEYPQAAPKAAAPPADDIPF